MEWCRLSSFALTLSTACVFEAPPAVVGEAKDAAAIGALDAADAPDAAEPQASIDASFIDAAPMIAMCGDGAPDTEEACDDGADNGRGPGFCNLACDAVDTSLPYVPGALQTFSDLDLVLDDGDLIDTSRLTVSGSTLGRSFRFSNQAPSGPMIAVLHLRSLVLVGNATVSVTGLYPLVILAKDEVRIEGVLDCAAHGFAPGPGGGVLSGLGSGGEAQGNFGDGGGGGGGHGTSGGRGGNAGDQGGGAGGASYNEGTPALQGGSGGAPGSAGDCPATFGGAGGGAIMIYAGRALRIDGAVTTGGGGGAAGSYCNDVDTGGGAGGGSGGMIVLWSPSLSIAGAVVADGGGGGSSGDASEDLPGFAGSDGRLDALPALGGPGRGASGANGGRGGTGTVAPENGADQGGSDNGGGGGGATGRIRIATREASGIAGVISPSPAEIETY